jgi:hypothetical protein
MSQDHEKDDTPNNRRSFLTTASRLTMAGAVGPYTPKHLLRVTEVTSRHPKRDALILLLASRAACV